MAQNSKTIRRRIKSIGNTKKITKAMELVSASKMRRAVSAVLATRPYAQLAWNTVSAVVHGTNESHSLLEINETAQKSLVVVFASDRGLAGSFTVNVIKLARKVIAEEKNADLICIGRRGVMSLQRFGAPVIAQFEHLTNAPTFGTILPISTLVMDEYQKKTYKKVILVYTDFISAITQTPTALTLLPFGTASAEAVTGKEKGGTDASALEYVFEPNPQDVLGRMLPRLIETVLYQALLETAASEHSARMLAMRNASDAAADMISELTLTYNQIRQAAITQEIAEISTGKAAIEAQ